MLYARQRIMEPQKKHPANPIDEMLKWKWVCWAYLAGGGRLCEICERGHSVGRSQGQKIQILKPWGVVVQVRQLREQTSIITPSFSNWCLLNSCVFRHWRQTIKSIIRQHSELCYLMLFILGLLDTKGSLQELFFAMWNATSHSGLPRIKTFLKSQWTSSKKNVYIISTASFIAQGWLLKGFHCPPGPVAFGALLHKGFRLVINLEAIYHQIECREWWKYSLFLSRLNQYLSWCYSD
jgi:hypothetical protein